MEGTTQRPASQGGRAASEAALLDALERVLQRDGLRNLTVNAIVDAAGVGKPLLYRYFGGLSGLVRAYGERRGPWTGIQQGLGGAPPGADGDAAPEDEMAFRMRVADELVASTELLRAHPVSLEFLAEELTAPSDLSEGFAAARDQQRRPFLRKMLADPRYARRDHRRTIIVLYAALVYLAMRSRRAPVFMGLRLDSEAGWQDAMAMVREIATTMGGSGPDTGAPLKVRVRRKPAAARKR